MGRLVLGVWAKDVIWFNDIPVSLERVSAPNRFHLKVSGAAMDSIFEVDDTSTVEILPDVFVSAGPTVDPSLGNGVKIVIQAPQSIVIRRDKVKKRSKNG